MSARPQPGRLGVEGRSGVTIGAQGRIAVLPATDHGLGLRSGPTIGAQGRVAVLPSTDHGLGLRSGGVGRRRSFLARAKSAVVLVGLVVLALALAACGGGGDPSKPSVTLVVAGSGQSGSTDVASGADRLKAEGFRVTTTTSSATDASRWLTDLSHASGQADIVVAGSPALSQALGQVAAQQPQQHYVLVEGTVVANNVTSITLRRGEGAYLAGALAGSVTTQPDLFPLATGSKAVALVAAQDDPASRAVAEAFTAGVHAVDRTIQVQTVYVGAGDDQRADELARGLYTSGADVVCALAGDASAGVVRAARDLNRYAIGQTGPRNNDEQAHLLAFVTTRVGDALYRTVQGIQAGQIAWGQTVSYGLAEDSVALTYPGDAALVPPAVRDRVSDDARQIMAGQIALPAAT